MRRLTVVLMLVACGRGGESSAPGHLARRSLPAGWTEESRSTYDEKTIFDYIDGGAERYLRRGFHRLYTARYVDAAKDELTVDLYDMGNPENAAAIFADTRVPDPRPVAACDRAEAHDYGVELRRGRVYGEIMVLRGDPALKAAAVAFARAVCAE
jgi:hypothetical protein